MRKHTLVYSTIFATIFAGSLAAAGIDQNPEDEARARADRPSASAEYGDVEEAKAMLDRAIAAVMTDKSGAINKFNYNDPKFRDRDLFVFCFNGQDGKYTAHEAMVGRDVRAFRDAKGKPFGQQMYEIATEGEILSVDYFSPVPGLVDLAYKRAYLTRVGDQVCGVSAYQFEH